MLHISKVRSVLFLKILCFLTGNEQISLVFLVFLATNYFVTPKRNKTFNLLRSNVTHINLLINIIFMVTDKEIFDVLKDWNPWWADKNKLNLYVGITRNSYKAIFNYISQREILIFKGVRRSGKSTILYQIIDYLLNNGVKTEQILFVNLEDKKLSDVSLEDIYSSYRKNLNNNKKAYIFLDEVHRKEDWEFWIRKKYDLKTNDKFFVSGSCSYLLEKEYSTLLTGRNITFTIYPLSYKEVLEFSDLKLDYNKISKGLITTDLKYQLLNLLKDYFKTGGFPEVFLSPKINKKRLLGQYFDDILYKDVVDRYDLTSSKVKDLSLYFMNNISNKYSLRNVRSALNISYDTIKDYLSYFKESYLFFD